MILIVSKDWRKYRDWMKQHFPYFGMYACEKQFPRVTLQAEEAKGLERGTCYMNPFDEPLPEWFKLRFTRVKIDDTTPKHQSFGVPYGGD